MESKTKIFGHPIHPMLIIFPLGLFVTAVICDVIQLFNHSTTLPIVSYYNIAGGILGGLIAAIFGFRDWTSIPKGTRARRIGAFHGIGNVILVGLFFVSWLMRREQPGFTPSALALVFSFAGIILGTLTAWLGGELVYRLDVAVDSGANLDAPSSLSGEPAGVTQSRMAVPVTGEERGSMEDRENR
jgi:uncharacterized membrane protein